MKKLVTRENIFLMLLIVLIGQNVFLQIRIGKAIEASENANYNAQQAILQAEKATNNAQAAANWASDASEKAEDAARNAFGNQCFQCP